MTTLPPSFFDRDVLEVGRDLLGALVVHQPAAGTPVAVRLTEVEAYAGPDDPASHAFRGVTARNAVMAGPPGRAYVYFTYGMHFCLNVSCGPAGTAAAVLLRAGAVERGAELATARRGGSAGRPVTGRDLARGPARLCQALGVDRRCLGADLTAPASPLRLEPGAPVPDDAVRRGPRVGVTAAADRTWRLWVDGDPTVSAYRRHTPRQR